MRNFLAHLDLGFPAGGGGGGGGISEDELDNRGFVLVSTTTIGLAGIGAAAVPTTVVAGVVVELPTGVTPMGVETTTGRAFPAESGVGGLGGSPVEVGPAGVSMAKRCGVNVVSELQPDLMCSIARVEEEKKSCQLAVVRTWSDETERQRTRTRPDCLTLDGERASADQPSLPIHDGEGE
jgi:hypothetical protein